MPEREWISALPKDTFRFGGSKARRGSKHEIKVYVHRYKWFRQCAYCDENEPRALHFHHRDPKSKKFNISKATDYSLNQVRAEMEKCDLVCANCHAKIHANRMRDATRTPSREAFVDYRTGWFEFVEEDEGVVS